MKKDKKMNSYKTYLSNLKNGIVQPKKKIIYHTVFALITIIITNVLIRIIIFLTGIQKEFVEHLEVLSYPPNPLSIFIAISVFPFVEEICFRLFLSLKKTHILVSASLMFSLFISISLLAILKNEIENHFLFFFVTSMFLFIKSLIMFSIPILKQKPISEQLMNLFKSHFKIAYFGSAFLFSLLHIFFYSLYLKQLLLINLLFFCSYFITGLVFNNARISLGFLYVVILHGFINAIGFLKYL